MNGVSCTIGSPTHSRTPMFRYLPGLLFLQVASGMLLWAALVSSLPLWAFLLTAALVTLATAFWCAAITRHRVDLAVSRRERQHGSTVERLRVEAERDRSKQAERHRRDVQRVERRAAWKSRTKTLGAFGIAAGFGVLMLLTELFTLGLLTLGSAASGVAGYLLHWRQTRREGDAGVLPDGRRPPPVVLPVRREATLEAPRELASRTGAHDR